MAQAIVKLIKSPSSRKTMGKNGRQYVVENRSWEMVAKKTVQIFEGLMDGALLSFRIVHIIMQEKKEHILNITQAEHHQLHR